MLKIAICDDDQILSSKLEEYIDEYQLTCDINIHTTVFNTGERLLDFLIKGSEYDLIFLDIELGTTTGISVGTKIREQFNDYDSKIVFITSKDGYETELFDVQPLNLLKKPIEIDKFNKCIDLTRKMLKMENQIFEYKVNQSIVRVRHKDIMYFEIVKRKLRIVTVTGEDYFYDTIANIKNRLSKSFVEPHSSYLVNFENIARINRLSIIMNNHDEIPVSQRGLKTMRALLLSNGGDFDDNN